MIMAALTLSFIVSAAGSGPNKKVMTPHLVGESRCTGSDDPAVERLGSLRFTRDEYVAALNVAVELRRNKLEPLPDFPLCYDPPGEQAEIERSATARRILRKYRLSTAIYLERMWSLMLALTYPELLERNTDAIRANRDLTADPAIKRLLAALNPE